MKNWKCAITLATCCGIVLTIAPSASADFVGVTTVIKDDPDIEFLCTQANGQFVPGPLTVCNVFAVFDDPSDRLLTVQVDLQVYDGQTPDVFFQHPATANSPYSPGCNQITDPPPFGFPDLICDSFITIGLKCSVFPPGDGTAAGTDFVFDEFRFNGHVTGWWFNIPPDNGQADAGNYPDLQVLFLQSSVAQGLSMSGMMEKIFWEDPATGDLIAEVNMPIKCAASCGSCPTDNDGDGDTNAADLAVLLGNWGPVDAGNCQDADGNGLIDAFDLAVLLGAWGPCL